MGGRIATGSQKQPAATSGTKNIQLRYATVKGIDAMSLDKPVDAITEDDLQQLIINKVSEKKTIDYKSELPGKNDDARKEFLADVSSFANAPGGWLIYGIQEQEAIPTVLSGINVDKPDETIRRLESMAQDGIRPRITLSGAPVLLKEGTYVFVLHIPRSYTAPHMVTYKGGSRFFSRNSRGKYQLDVDELRKVFVRSETIADRMREFRIQRIADISAGETPVSLEAGAKIVLHLVPFTAFDLRSDRSYDLVSLTPDGTQFLRLQPFKHKITYHRFNFKGFLTLSEVTNSTAKGYVQIYRTGIVEVVDAHMLRVDSRAGDTIPGNVLDREFLDALPRYLTMLQNLGIETPLALMVTFIGMRGYYMASSRATSEYYNRIEQDVLDIPEVIIDTYDVSREAIQKLLRPISDTLWNATGYSRSMNYDENGNWAGDK